MDEADPHSSDERSRVPAEPRWSPQRRWGLTLVFVLVGLALRWHATRVPYFSDDYMQLGMLAGMYPGDHAWWDLYTFIRADPEELALHRAVGTLPWWTFDDINGSVLRPLSSLTLYLDWQLWPSNAFASHLHNLAWWAAMLASASRLLFRVLPGRVAALAIAIMALDHGVSMNVGWVANRATLLCATFAFLALSSHIDRRQSIRPLRATRHARNRAGSSSIRSRFRPLRRRS